jgi:hypothetical protein
MNTTIFSVCVNPDSGKYVAFLKDDPSKIVEGMSHADAVGQLVMAGYVPDVYHQLINED